MSNLKRSILYLMLLLAFIFNIEKLDVGIENIVDINTFVYGMIFFAVLLIAFVPAVRNLKPAAAIVLFTLIYFALRIFVFNAHPLFSYFYTYLTITEITLLAASILLAYFLGNTLAEYENVIEKITFPRDGRVTDINNAQDVVKTEFIRSRRHNRPLSIVVVEMDPHTNQLNFEQTVKSIQQAMLNRFLFASLAKILSDEARRTDLILEQRGKNQFVLLCPETTTPGSINLAERVQDLANEKLGVKVKCGIASFPDEALTFDDLVKKAGSNLLTPEELTAQLAARLIRVEEAFEENSISKKPATTEYSMQSDNKG